MFSGRAVSFFLFGILLVVPAFADIPCASGNLSSLIGTTCDIGSLQFDFTDGSGANFVYDAISNTTTYGIAASTSEFTFTALSNGFTLGFSGGPQSVTGPGGDIDSYAVNEYILHYNVVDSAGNIVGENVTGGTLSATGSDLSYADGIGLTVNSSSSYVQGGNQAYQQSGLSTNQNVTSVSGSPFSSGFGQADPFILFARNADSASWDGTPTTFTFTSDAPEPGFTPLLGLGILAAAWVAARRGTSKSIG
jgi:hypothetical protein